MERKLESGRPPRRDGVYSWRFVQCCFAFESQPLELRFGDAHQLISRSLTDGRLNKQLGQRRKIEEQATDMVMDGLD